MKPCFLALLFTALRLGPALAEELSPEAVVQACLAHSHRLERARLDVAAQAARQRQVLAAARPTLRLEAGATFYEGLEDAALGPGIVIPAIEERYGASAALSQLLYAGGAVVHGVRAAAAQLRALEDARDAVAQGVAREALTRYWTWARAVFGLGALEAAAARVAAHAADVASRRAAGLATENEALAAAVLLDRTRLRLEDARRAEALARARLATLAGLDLPADRRPQEPGAARALEAAGLAAYAAGALIYRPEAAAARAAVEAAAEECRAQRGGWFPHVRAVGRYARANPNAQFFPPRDEWEDDALVAATATWDVLDGGLTRARVQEAAVRLAQAEARLAETEETVLLEVREACIGLQGTLSSLLVATRAEESARRNVGVVGDLWKAGLARHSDVLAAEADLTDMEYGVAAARVDVVLARVALAYAAGRLEAETP